MQKSLFTDYRFQVGVTVFLYAGLSAFYNFSSLHTLFWWREIILWPFLALILFNYLGLYRQLMAGKIPRLAIVMTGVLVSLVAMTIPPFHSTDIFGYINRGWQQLHYGLNPYVHTVDHILNWQSDPMITDHWVSNPSPYGFLYLQIAKFLCFIGEGNKSLTLWVFKFSNVIVHCVTATLVWFGVSRLHQSPSENESILLQENVLNTESHQQSLISSEKQVYWADIALFLYALNPLILLHGLANGHNDLWMGLFLTWAALASVHLMGGLVWLLPALAASVLIKYGSVVLVPFAGLFLLRQKAWKALFFGSVLAAILIVLVGLPYLPDWANFHLKEIGRNALVSHSSLHSFIFSLWKIIVTAIHPEWRIYKELVREILSKVLIGSFAIFYVGLFIRRIRQVDYSGMDWLRDAVLILVVLITLISLKFYAWYLGLFLAMSFLLPKKDWLRRLVFALSIAQLLSFTVIGQAHILNFFLMTALPWVLFGLSKMGWSRQRVVTVAIFIPITLLLLAFAVCALSPAIVSGGLFVRHWV